MKRIALIAGILIIGCVYTALVRHRGPQVDDRLVQGYNSFGCRLFKDIASRHAGRNILVSPACASMSLALLCNGARGNTKKAILETLQIRDMTLDRINQGNRRLLNSARELDEGPSCTLSQSLYLQKDVSLQPDYARTVESYYGAGIKRTTFGSRPDNREASSHAPAKSRHSRSAAVDESHGERGLAVLGNSHFKSESAGTLDKSQAVSPYTNAPMPPLVHPFLLSDDSDTSVPVIARGCRFGYQQTDLFESVRLPYAGKGISLYIFMAQLGWDKYEVGWRRLLEAVNAKNLNLWMMNYHDQGGLVVLPLFSLRSQNDLRSAVTDLKGGTIFAPRSADFSGIAPRDRLRIDDFREQDIVDDAEEIANTYGRDGACAQVNRPFIFLIRDDRTGLILFMGIVENPLQKD